MCTSKNSHVDSNTYCRDWTFLKYFFCVNPNIITITTIIKTTIIMILTELLSDIYSFPHLLINIDLDCHKRSVLGISRKNKVTACM